MKARIREGAIVWMDFRALYWPELPHGDSRIVFDVTPSGMDGYVNCRANYFGLHKPNGEYGDGALHVKEQDIVKQG